MNKPRPRSAQGVIIMRPMGFRVRVITSVLTLVACLAAGTTYAGDIDMRIELKSGLVYLPVTINGSEETCSFILDTGAMVSAIDPATAGKLGLDSVGQAHAMGAGSETHAISIFQATTFTIGSETIENVMLAGVPLAPLTIHTGRPLDGVLGHNVLSRYVVEIDYEHERVVLHDPSSWTYEGSGDEIPIHFNMNLPFVYAGIEEESEELHLKHEGLFVLDTGASPALILNHEFAEQNGLFDLTETLIEGPAGFGIGGAVRGKVGRLPELRIGANVLLEPVVNFTTEPKGALAMPDMAGVIGAKVLSRFRVILDYPGARLILEPNESLRDPFDYDTFGAHLVLQGGNIEVYAVLPGTPASDIGVEPGDRVLTVNGKTALDLGLDVLEEMFLDPDLEYRIDLMRDGKKISKTVLTRKLL